MSDSKKKKKSLITKPELIYRQICQLKVEQCLENLLLAESSPGILHKNEEQWSSRISHKMLILKKLL